MPVETTSLIAWTTKEEKARAIKESKSRGISLSAFIRESVEKNTEKKNGN